MELQYFTTLVVFIFSTGYLHYVWTAPPSKLDYKCPRAEGSYAHPSTCRRFFMCSENHPYAQSCPPGLYFDDIKKHCQHKTKDLVCGPVPLPDIETTTNDPLKAQKCDESQCILPDCHCSRDGTLIPGRLNPKDIPMMITISFDGALNHQNIDYYKRVFDVTGKNPNGCPASFTFFVSHHYSSYFHIQKMAAAGHEIALNGIYNRSPETWWQTASKEELMEQYEGLRTMLVKFANLTKDSIVGLRAPFLRSAGNEMIEMMQEMGLLYDSSMPVATKVPLWPYTFEYQVPHTCVGGKLCPTRSFEGIWEYPLNMLFSDDGTGGNCALVDQCVFQQDEDLVYDFLMENFNRHYKDNRAPLSLSFHSNFFQHEEKVVALKRFIKKIQATHKDVYFVSVKRAIEFSRNPSEDPAAFDCAEKPPTSCNIPRTCILNHLQGKVEDTMYMQTCSECPHRYPWVGNPEGKSLPGDIFDDEKPREFRTPDSDALTDEEAEEDEFGPDNY